MFNQKDFDEMVKEVFGEDAYPVMRVKGRRMKTVPEDWREVNLDVDYVIFNRPATIVFWKDGTKTIVKCGKGDKWDKEKALALCYMKKCLGNKSNFNNTLKSLLDKYTEEC